MTMVVVTHELASAFLIADRMVYVDRGHIVALGTKEEFKASTHPRVRQFLDRVPEPEVTRTRLSADAHRGPQEPTRRVEE